MRLIFLALVLIYNFSTYAESLPQLASSYRMTSEINLQVGWREETMVYSSIEGKRRFTELRKAGWQCQLKKGLGFCRIFQVAPLTADEVQQIKLQFSDLEFIRIEAPLSAPELILEAPDYSEYRLTQTLTWGVKQWPQLKLTLLKGLIKLNLPNHSWQTEETFVILENGQLQRQVHLVRKFGQWIRETLVLGLHWAEQQE